MDDDQTPILSRSGRGSKGPTILKCLALNIQYIELNNVIQYSIFAFTMAL